MSLPGDDQMALRRPSARGNRFEPRPVDELAEPVVLQRNVLRASSSGSAEQQTSRRHEIAGDLPAWEPLPPGELFLKRPGS